MTGLPTFTIPNPFLVTRAMPQIQFIKELPMTPTGKIVRRVLRKLEIEKNEKESNET